mgnify:CR=1 FL=1
MCMYCFGLPFCERKPYTTEYLWVIRYSILQRDFHLHGVDKNTILWQQDGASLHTTNVTIQYFCVQFSGGVISKYGDCPCPLVPLILQYVIFSFGVEKKPKIWNGPLHHQLRTWDSFLQRLLRNVAPWTRSLIILEAPCHELTNHPALIRSAMLMRARHCVNAGGKAFSD